MAVSGVDPVSDDGVHRTMFDPSATNPCAAVVEAIETAIGDELDAPLAHSIDPDTLVQLYRHDGNDSWMFHFEHAGTEVTVWGTGRIHVDPTAIREPSGVDDPISGTNTPG
ncbi:MAG: HalOD1 output domain-containing protein [Halohasta sp.]